MTIQSHTVRHGGYNLHVVTAGSESAPPFLLLHCWNGNWSQWETTIQHLGDRFHFIVPDHLGFGRSDKPAGDFYQITHQAERTYYLLRHFGYDRAIVMGHSMGGMIGLTLAGMMPSAVEKLIVVAPAVTGKLHPFAKIATLVYPIVRQNIAFPIEAGVALSQTFPFLRDMVIRMFISSPENFIEQADYWTNQLIADGQVFSSAWAEKAITEGDTTPLLGDIRAPTLAIWGAMDFTVPVQECEVLEAHIRNFEAHIIPHVGHLPMIEAWDVYIQQVEAFLTPS